MVDGKVDPKFRQESIVLLRESKMVSTDEGCGDLEQELQMVGVNYANYISSERYDFYL